MASEIVVINATRKISVVKENRIRQFEPFNRYLSLSPMLFAPSRNQKLAMECYCSGDQLFNPSQPRVTDQIIAHSYTVCLAVADTVISADYLCCTGSVSRPVVVRGHHPVFGVEDML